MQKIKFKIAYKPLSTEQVNKHKDFDALMGMYAAAPQLNFFQKLFKNKWIMFSSGIIIGGLIATVIALNSTDKSPDTIAQNNTTNNTLVVNADTITNKDILNRVNKIVGRNNFQADIIDTGE